MKESTTTGNSEIFKALVALGAAPENVFFCRVSW